MYATWVLAAAGDNTAVTQPPPPSFQAFCSHSVSHWQQELSDLLRSEQNKNGKNRISRIPKSDEFRNLHKTRTLYFRNNFSLPKDKVDEPIKDSSSHCLKMTQMSHLNFSILAFYTDLCPTKTDLSGNTV